VTLAAEQVAARPEREPRVPDSGALELGADRHPCCRDALAKVAVEAAMRRAGDG